MSFFFSRLISILVLTILLLPTFLGIAGISFDAINENRISSKFPKFQTTSQKEYFDQINNYLVDSFPIREILINRVHLVKSRWLKIPTSDVLIGKNNWLFYIGNNVIKDITGKLKLSEDEISNWISIQQKKQYWLNDRGVPYLFVAIPNKSSIYQEYLPDWLQKYIAESRLTQVTKWNSNSQSLNLLNLSNRIQEIKGSGTLAYWQNDTHWSGETMRLCLEEIFLQAKLHIENLNTNILFENSSIENVTEPGDLARVLGLEKEWPEAIRSKLKTRAPVGLRNASSEISMLERFSKLPRDHYGKPQVFENDNGNGTVVIFHDSFLATAIYEERLARHPVAFPFKRTILIWDRPSIALIKEIFEIEHPDIVIEESVERMLFEPIH